MALKSRMRGWLGVPSETALNDAVTALRGDLARFAGEDARLAGEDARLGGENTRLAEEVGALRLHGEAQAAQRQSEIETLRNDLAALADRFAVHTDRHYATAEDLAALLSRIEGRDAAVEDMRIALAGLTEQARWESDDLRKGLAAIIERVERQRKPA